MDLSKAKKDQSFGVFLSSPQAEFSINRATTSSIFSLYLFLVGIFSVWGGRSCDRFGPRIVVLVMGVLMISWGIGSAVGPYIGGLSFDFTGTYRLAFLSGGLIILLMAICARDLAKPIWK